MAARWEQYSYGAYGHEGMELKEASVHRWQPFPPTFTYQGTSIPTSPIAFRSRYVV